MPTHAIATTGEAVDPTTGQLDGYMTKYKSYIGLVSQSGTDAPTIAVLNQNDSNFLGEISWARNRAGLYEGTLLGAFPGDKTYAIINNNVSPIYSFIIAVGSEDSVFIQVTDSFGDMQFQDGGLNNTPFEIRVYQ